MNIRPSTLMRALLGIYREQRKPRGGTLALATLEREWRKTGLRRSDLDTALQELLQRRMLQQRPQMATAAYELTYLGVCAMRALRLNAGYESLRDWMTLRQLRRRRGVPAAPGQRRRSSDTV